MDLQWINPDAELPPVTSLVIIAIGTEQNKITDYKLAKMGSSGAFVVDAYPQCNCLYLEKSPHRHPVGSKYANNAYRVIAFAEFEQCNLDEIIEQKPPQEGEEGYGLYQYLMNGK